MNVELKIFDSRGSLVRELVSGSYGAGRHNILWNGRSDAGKSLSSGIYYIRLNAGNSSYIHKSLMIK
jgi:flagellar hook assembly protein FlgD